MTVAIPSYKIKEVSDRARNILRDTGVHFSTTLHSDGTPLSRPLPMKYIKNGTVVVQTDLNSTTPVTLVEGTNFTIDYENGRIKFLTSVPAGATIWIEGDNYEWFSKKQLDGYVEVVLGNYEHSEGDNLLLLMDDPAVINVMAYATLVEALWSLYAEIARDIDVRSSETDIPATQRFRQVGQFLEQFEDELRTREAMLNIGLYKIEMFNLRRVSRTTGRLVPIYIEQEYDDLNPPVRVKPLIDAGGPVVRDSTATVIDNAAYPLEVIRGTSFTFYFTYEDPVDFPVDLTGYTASFVVKIDRDINSPALITKTDTDGITLGSDGSVTLALDTGDTNLTDDVYVYDLVLFQPDMTPILFLRGPFTVEATTV